MTRVFYGKAFFTRRGSLWLLQVCEWEKSGFRHTKEVSHNSMLARLVDGKDSTISDFKG